MLETKIMSSLVVGISGLDHHRFNKRVVLSHCSFPDDRYCEHLFTCLSSIYIFFTRCLFGTFAHLKKSSCLFYYHWVLRVSVYFVNVFYQMYLFYSFFFVNIAMAITIY